MSTDGIWGSEPAGDAGTPASGADQEARFDEPAAVEPVAESDVPSGLDGSAATDPARVDGAGTDGGMDGGRPVAPEAELPGSDLPDPADDEGGEAGAGRPAADEDAVPAPGARPDQASPSRDEDAVPAPGARPDQASPSRDEDASGATEPSAGRKATRSRARSGSTPAGPVAVPVVPDPPTRSNANARLAHVHVATGMYGLARAELETLAAHGALDVPALADLAEVRWRTGDLVGAGEAADAHLQAGGHELIAICVAAEAASAAGRSADARNLAARVLARGRDRLDDLFAGQPRGAIWPPAIVSERPSAVPPSAVLPPGGPVALGAPRPAPAASPGMSGDLAEIQARLDSGEFAGAGTRLALVLRTHPVLAPAILSIADQALQAGPPAQEVAALHLVRGDAYRLMGRESLAAEAFQQSTRALRARPSEEKT